jgi:ribosomal protein S18 acetylase RimI-like enzyme
MTTRPLGMVLVRETVIDDWQALRDIRLEALRDAPSAFGSSYEREAAFGEPDWLRRIARGGNFLAFIPEVGASEVRASEVRASEVRASEVRASEVSASEVRASEVRASEVRASEVRASEPAGLIGGYPETADIVELVSMYVRPKARGRGVGEALVAAVFAWAQAQDAKTVHLWVTESNDPARALYERCGFSPTGERQPLPSDPSLDEIAMARPL